MKKIFTFFVPIAIGILLTATIWAQSPEKMSYQAVIRNTGDDLVINTQVGMQISILQSSSSGIVVYVETQTPTTNANGLVSIEIGAGTVEIGDFTSIDWANGPYFIKTETDLAGGTSYTITGVSQLMSVPYALYAKNSGSSIPGPQGIQGETGATGAIGADGKSAYELWIEAGNTGTQAEFLVSIKGAKGNAGEKGDAGIQGKQGLQGETGAVGPQGEQGIQGEAGINGLDGVDGKSAYELWIDAGNTGTEDEFLASLQGAKGDTGETGAVGIQGEQGIQGEAGINGIDGVDGKSAYELWTDAGNTGTEVEFLASLQGAKGDTGETGAVGIQGEQGIQGEAGINGIDGVNGKSAYEIWIEAGNTGTEAEFLASLQGETGATGSIGPQGLAGADGQDGVGGVTEVAGTSILSLTGTGTVADPYIIDAIETDPEFTNWDKDYADLINKPTTITTGQAEAIVANTAKIGVTPGTAAGQMQYWNGTAWVVVAPSPNEGATLQMIGGVPKWVGGTPPPPVIGDSYQGGVVFYILQSGDPGYVNGETHGLIAATSDQGWITWWNGSYVVTGATATALGTGSTNTTLIISAQGNTGTYAAKVCADYSVTVDGVAYDDWYLPSHDELYKFYLARSVVPGFSYSYYWSSSEADTNYAWWLNTYPTYLAAVDKKGSYAVRAIRSF